MKWLREFSCLIFGHDYTRELPLRSWIVRRWCNRCGRVE